MQIKFVKTHPDAVIPTRGSAGSAGFDSPSTKFHLPDGSIWEGCP